MVRRDAVPDHHLQVHQGDADRSGFGAGHRRSTFHGVTRPVTLEASFKAAGNNPMNKAYTVGFEVKGSLKRSDFGVKTYVPVIADGGPDDQRAVREAVEPGLTAAFAAPVADLA